MSGKKVPKIAVTGPQRGAICDAINTAVSQVQTAYDVRDQYGVAILSNIRRRAWIEVEALLKQDRRPKAERKAKR